MLRQYTDLPPGFLDAKPQQLEAVLGGPSLIHLPGLRDRPLFVSILLHGNETSGLEAIQALLRPFLGRPLPRALSLFVGNVAAARAGLRRLDDQPDYNRAWPGGVAQDSPEARMLAEVVDQMRQRRVFAAIDIHNNTGRNPHYACVNRLDGRYLHLASLFGSTVVYFTRPKGVASMAFAEHCPSVTVECGRPGEAYAAEHAREFVEAALHLREIRDEPATQLSVYQTTAILRVPEGISFGFGDANADLQLMEDLDQLNFRDLPVGTSLARVMAPGRGRVRVEDSDGEDVTDRYLELESGELRTRVAVTPSMLTADPRIIRQDCLGYLMERLDWNQAGAAIGSGDRQNRSRP